MDFECSVEKISIVLRSLKHEDYVPKNMKQKL